MRISVLLLCLLVTACGVTMKPGGSSKVVSEKVEGRRTGEPVIDLDAERAAVQP